MGTWSCWNAFFRISDWQNSEQPLLKVIFTWITCRSRTLSWQDYTFRDHFYSFQLERWVSKVFGLANHDEELWYSLLNVKQSVNNDSFICLLPLMTVLCFLVEYWGRGCCQSGSIKTWQIWKLHIVVQDCVFSSLYIHLLSNLDCSNEKCQHTIKVKVLYWNRLKLLYFAM